MILRHQNDKLNIIGNLLSNLLIYWNCFVSIPVDFRLQILVLQMELALAKIAHLFIFLTIYFTPLPYQLNQYYNSMLPL